MVNIHIQSETSLLNLTSLFSFKLSAKHALKAMIQAMHNLKAGLAIQDLIRYLHRDFNGVQCIDIQSRHRYNQFVDTLDTS